jgi:hypothetical protein
LDGGHKGNNPSYSSRSGETGETGETQLYSLPVRRRTTPPLSSIPCVVIIVVVVVVLASVRHVDSSCVQCCVSLGQSFAACSSFARCFRFVLCLRDLHPNHRNQSGLYRSSINSSKLTPLPCFLRCEQKCTCSASDAKLISCRYRRSRPGDRTNAFLSSVDCSDSSEL